MSNYDPRNDIWRNTWHAEPRGQQSGSNETSQKTYERNVLGWMQDNES